MKHGYRIEGNINGRPVLGLGTGRTDPASGVSEMEVHFEYLAEGWDPRTIVLMCCDRATVMASREIGSAVGMYRASGGYMTIGRDLVNAFRRGLMRDEAGTIMVDVQASSVTDFRHETRYDSSRIEGGISHLRRGVNGIAEVKPFRGVMMQAGPRLVTVTTSYEALLEDGSTLYGTTFYPHFLPEQQAQVPGFQTLSVTSVEQEFDGRNLWVRTTSEVSPLSAESGTNEVPASAVTAAQTGR